MLNIMETFPLAEYGHNSTRALHTMIEAKKLAYADMIRYDADPRFAEIPVDGLKSKEFAKTRAALIDAAKAMSTAMRFRLGGGAIAARCSDRRHGYIRHRTRSSRSASAHPRSRRCKT